MILREQENVFLFEFGLIVLAVLKCLFWHNLCRRSLPTWRKVILFTHFCTNERFSPYIMCVQYIGGCSVHRRIPWVHRGMFSTLGDVQCIGRISWCMWGSKLIEVFQFLLKTPMYYWTSPDVLMVSPRCTHWPHFWETKFPEFSLRFPRHFKIFPWAAQERKTRWNAFLLAIMSHSFIFPWVFQVFSTKIQISLRFWQFFKFP